MTIIDRIEELRNDYFERVQFAGSMIPTLHHAELCRDLLFELAPDLRKLVEACEPFRHFIDTFDSKPMLGTDDAVYSIHGGTPIGSELRLSKMRELRAALAAFTDTGAKTT